MNAIKKHIHAEEKKVVECLTKLDSKEQEEFIKLFKKISPFSEKCFLSIFINIRYNLYRY